MFSVMFSDLTSGGGREVGKGAATPYEILFFFVFSLIFKNYMVLSKISSNAPMN